MNRTQASVDAVFFDLFGTLVRYRDMASGWDDWLKALAEIIGQKPEQLSGHCEGFMSQPEPEISEDGLTLYERRLRRLCGELEISSPPALLHEAATATISAWGAYITADPDAGPVLRDLSAKFPLALISNFDHPPYVHGLLQQLDLRQYFAIVVVSGDVGVSKPDPRIFEPALKAVDRSPDRVIYVGDSAEDMEGARRAGMQPVLLDIEQEATHNDYGSGAAAIPTDKANWVVGSLVALREQLLNRSTDTE
jgi:HAD superfamily hydrolase (TIGR01549 family)